MKTQLKGYLKNILYKIKRILKYYSLKRKNKSLGKNLGPHNKDDLGEYLVEYKKYSKKRGLPVENKRVSSYVSFNNNNDLNYITEEYYKYYIEPALNFKRYSTTLYQNKAYLDLLPKAFGSINDVFIPIYLRKINGLFYDNEFRPISSPQNIIKDIDEKSFLYKEIMDTGGSRGVEMFHRRGTEFINSKGEKFFENLIKNSDNFLIQKRVQNHSILSSFNASSLNTLRLITYRSVETDKIIILHHFLRFGGCNSYFDNAKEGGFILVKPDGKFSNFKVFRDYTYKKIQTEESYPLFEETIETAKKIAVYFPYHRVLGFDFTVTNDNELKLVEINTSLNPEATNYLSGSILGSYTEEVLQYVGSKKIHKHDLII